MKLHREESARTIYAILVEAGVFELLLREMAPEFQVVRLYSHLPTQEDGSSCGLLTLLNIYIISKRIQSSELGTVLPLAVHYKTESPLFMYRCRVCCLLSTQIFNREDHFLWRFATDNTTARIQLSMIECQQLFMSFLEEDVANEKLMAILMGNLNARRSQPRLPPQISPFHSICLDASVLNQPPASVRALVEAI